MLLLGRCVGERIMIGDDIILTVVEIRDRKVRLGIEAPAGVPIHREEILRKIQQEMADLERGEES